MLVDLVKTKDEEITQLKKDLESYKLMSEMYDDDNERLSKENEELAAKIKQLTNETQTVSSNARNINPPFPQQTEFSRSALMFAKTSLDVGFKRFDTEEVCIYWKHYKEITDVSLKNVDTYHYWRRNLKNFHLRLQITSQLGARDIMEFEDR